jgi:hypothetical protein
VVGGETVSAPSAGTVAPFSVTVVALDVSQVKVADSPAVIVAGMAVKLSMVTPGRRSM